MNEKERGKPLQRYTTLIGVLVFTGSFNTKTPLSGSCEQVFFNGSMRFLTGIRVSEKSYQKISFKN
jgi:hypothetical protein